MNKPNKFLVSSILLLILVVSFHSKPYVSADARLLQESNPVEIIESMTGEDVTLLEGGVLPYYSMENELDFYQSGEFTFRVDSKSGQIVEVYPADSSTVFALKDKEISLDELETLAKDIIAQLAIEVEYELLTLQVGSKGEVNYFFRWNGGDPNETDFGKCYIQVGLTKDGQLLNLVNTLPFMKQSR